MLSKVILICSELWRLKRRHFSEYRDGSEEETVDKIADFISKIHLTQANQIEHLETNANNFVEIKTEIHKNTYIKITEVISSNGHKNRYFKHTLNYILEEYFKNNPDLSKIKLPEYKYKKHETS